MSNYEPRVTGTKVCSKCHEEKNVLAFGVDSRACDGLQSQCRDCDRLKAQNIHVKKKISRMRPIGD